MYRLINLLMKLLITFLAVWTSYVSMAAFLDITIYFPFTISEVEYVPYHRWQTVRIAVFLTISYFAILHLFGNKREYLPIQFLETYIKILTIVGLIIFYKADVKNSEYYVILFFGLSSIILHWARRGKYRYFAKR